VLKEIKSRTDFEAELASENQIYFRLTGGLGNQLFGLSEAFNLHNKLQCKVLMDIGSLDHSKSEMPEWFDWSKNQDWFTLIRIPKNVSREFELTNLGDMDESFSPESRHFTGWRFSLRSVESSGLFSRAKFPFEVEEKPRILIALHYRAGDYALAEGIGILKPQYYSRALKKVDSSLKVTIFSDDNYAALSLINKLNIRNRFEISNQQSPVEVLHALSGAKNLITANSTLSWWALYFSNAVTKTAPKPFYLQIWNFDADAKMKNTIYLSRFVNFLDLTLTRMKWFLRSI